jgi:hypothetical protein
MSDAPDRIFLQDAGDYTRAAAFEVTWCVDPQDDADTEYIRADKVRALVEAIKNAIALGMIPKSSAKDGGACRHSSQVHAADAIRAALAALDAKP